MKQTSQLRSMAWPPVSPLPCRQQHSLRLRDKPFALELTRVGAACSPQRARHQWLLQRVTCLCLRALGAELLGALGQEGTHSCRAIAKL